MKIIVNSLKREVTYIMPTKTEKELKKAEKLQEKLYRQYNSVTVLPYGLNEVKIIAKQAPQG